MSTRGIMGFVIDGQEKLAYNHSDSYPSSLGVEVVQWLRIADLNAVAAQARALTLVNEAVPPTPEQIEDLRRYSNLDVSSGSTDEWYALLRETQGRPQAMLDAGFLADYSGFALSSLHCEWGYVVDLDRAVFEVYKGSQREPHGAGRFAARGNAESQYQPIRLIAEWPLERLPSDAEVAALERSGGETE